MPSGIMISPARFAARYTGIHAWDEMNCQICCMSESPVSRVRNVEREGLRFKSDLRNECSAALPLPSPSGRGPTHVPMRGVRGFAHWKVFTPFPHPASDTAARRPSPGGKGASADRRLKSSRAAA